MGATAEINSNSSSGAALGLAVDSSFLAAADVSGDANQPNTVLTLTQSRADAGWAIAGNTATFTGSPDKVRIDAVTWFTDTSSAARQRVSPQLELLRNGAVVARSDTGYQRHTSNHKSSSNTIAFTDPAPGTDPQYQLRAQQSSNQDDVVDIDLGHLSADAIVKVQI